MKIWRYLDLAKLISLLETNSVYFARMDTFDDPFEGATPKGYINELINMSLDSGVSAGCYIAQHYGMAEDFRKETYVSCWHQSEFESEAMWSLYSDKQKGIAIVTTMEKLKAVLPSKVILDKVRYVDFDAEKVDIAPLPFYKRHAFEYEKEIRAVIVDKSESKLGLIVKMNPDDFIDKIIISPMAQQWFVDAVRGVCSKYNTRFDVEVSSLGVKPKYAFEEYEGLLE